MNLIFKLLLIIGLGFGANYFQPNFQQNSSGNLNIPDTLRLVGVMAQFPLENPDNPKTSGDGHFLSLHHEEYNHFYDSTTPRCDGFLVDRPPHNDIYFQKQLEAVGNYYKNVSDSNLFYTTKIIENSDGSNGYYTVSNKMEYYAKSDQLLAQFFTEVLELAQSDIEDYIDGKELPSNSTNPMFNIGRSVLKACDVNYTTESVPLFFEGTQFPVSAEMALSFMELEVMTREKITGSKGIVGGH